MKANQNKQNKHYPILSITDDARAYLDLVFLD